MKGYVQGTSAARLVPIFLIRIYSRQIIRLISAFFMHLKGACARNRVYKGFNSDRPIDLGPIERRLK